MTFIFHIKTFMLSPWSVKVQSKISKISKIAISKIATSKISKIAISKISKIAMSKLNKIAK